MIITAIIKLVTSLVILFSSSMFFYLTFKAYYVPKNTLLKENIYFNYSKEYPTAKLTLLADEKQWEYTQEARVSYIITIEIELSKSKRNQNIGKFMFGMKTIDMNNIEVASSSRPIIMPYQSTISKPLEGILFWPLRLFGLFKAKETIIVREQMMNNYFEPSDPTERVEFSLSTNQADIEAVYFTVFPKFNILTRVMFYHPKLAFLFGVAAIAFFELSVSLLGLGIYYLYRFANSPVTNRFQRSFTGTSSEGEQSAHGDSESEDSDDLFDSDGEEEEDENDDVEEVNSGTPPNDSPNHQAISSEDIEDDITFDIDDGVGDGLRKRK